MTIVFPTIPNTKTKKEELHSEQGTDAIQQKTTQQRGIGHARSFGRRQIQALGRI